MLMIRLARMGKPKQPEYRLLVSEKGRDLYGKFLENVGTYNPRTKEAILKEDRIQHWLNVGAQASPTVHNLLIEKKVIKGDRVVASKDRGRPKREAEAKAAAEAEVKAKADEAKAKAEADAAAKAAAAAPVETPVEPATEVAPEAPVEPAA